MNPQLRDRLAVYYKAHQELLIQEQSLFKQGCTQQEFWDKGVTERILVKESNEVLAKLIPLLSITAMEEAVNISNMALRAIFLHECELVFVEEDARFVVKTSEGDTDLVNGNGGGYLAVVSLIFRIFLMSRLGARPFLIADEAFTQLDSEAIVRFIDFIRVFCNSLSFDLLLVSHDERILPESVDTVYYLEEGKAVKV